MLRGAHGNHAKASAHWRWKAGSRVGSNGYVKVRVGKSHPLADPNGWAYEHLVVWCAAGNPPPEKGQIIHHRNDEKTDNRIENLEMLTRSEHNRHHNNEKGRDPATGRIAGKKAAGALLDGRDGREFPSDQRDKK